MPYLYRANVYTTIYEVVPDLEFGVFLEYLAGYMNRLLGRVSDDTFVMQAL